ncbi:MAG: HlyD family efflux transporter periplasmic adaptor subunit [Planctomycetaceae bacterium]
MNTGIEHPNTAPTAQQVDELRRSYRFPAAQQVRPSSPGKDSSSRPAPPSPPPTRPRGRFLIAALMFLACAGGVLTVWDSLFRYRAYGVVTGRIVNVSAPVDGLLQFVHVREGDEVRQDSRLATVMDLEYEQRLARVADELKVAEATLHAEIAKVQWTSQVQETEMSKSLAEFYEGAGNVHQEAGALGIIRDELQNTHQLTIRHAARESDLRRQTIQEDAQRNKLAAVQEALMALKNRAEAAAKVPRLGPEQVAPLVAKVDLLMNETQRIREWIAQGDLRAPVNGTVLQRHRPTGECVKSHEPLFTVMEEASLEIEMYLPQEMTADFQVGDTMNLKIEPFETLVPCEVTAIGNEYRQPPSNIEVFYRKSVRLLPVRVRPAAEFAADRRMSVGAVAKLPHFGTRG